MYSSNAIISIGKTISELLPVTNIHELDADKLAAVLIRWCELALEVIK